MKKILASLLLVASLGHADVVGPTPMQIPDSGGVWSITGSSPTYALASALTGVASSAIDLNGLNGLYVTLTATGQSIVSVYYSNSNVSATTTAIQSYQIQAPGNYFVPIKARYVSFYNAGQKPTARVSAYYYGASPSIVATVPTATPGIQPISVTSSVVLTTRATTGFTWSQTPTPYLLSTTAGTSTNGYVVTVMPNFGGSAVNVAFQGTTIASSDLLAGLGIYIPTTVTGGVAYGPYANQYILGKSTSSTNVTGVIQIDTVP